MAKILVVDDRADNRRYLTKLLSYGGHHLLEAGDGAEALLIALAEQPDLVISDIFMPTMDGFSFIHKVREDPDLANMKVVFYTATYHASQVRKLANDYGVRHILEKPSRPETVLKVVAEALGESVPPKKAVPASALHEEHLQLIAGKFGEKLDTLSGRLAAIIDLTLELSTERDPGQLLERACPTFREIIGARIAVLATLNEKGRQGSILADGAKADIAARLLFSLCSREELEKTFAERRTLQIPDRNGAAQLSGSAVDHTLLGVAIVSPTQIYGWVCFLDRVGVEGFSDEDERIATALAAQVGRIYESAILFGEVQRHAVTLEQEVEQRKKAEESLRNQVRLARLTTDVGQALTRGVSLGERLQVCAEAMIRHLDAGFARIWALSSDHQVLELQASAGLDKQIDGNSSRVPVGKFTIGRIAQERKPYLTNDVANDPRLKDEEWIKREAMAVFAGYPLLVGDQLFGVMALIARQPLADATTETLETVAQEVALGIKGKHAVDDLREKEEQVLLLLDSTEEAICGVDLNGDCTFLNQACLRILGYGNDSELLGKNMHGLVHHSREDRRPYPFEECRIFQAFRQGKGTHVSDEVFWRADGTSFPVEYWSHPIWHDGTIVGSVVTFLDISDRRQLEEQYRQAQKMEAVGTLAGGVAHDFNNLLTVISGYSELLLSQMPKDAQPSKMILEIKKASDRAVGLTRQLLAFSRKQVLVPVVLDLNTVVAELEKMIRRLIGEDIEVTPTLDPTLGQCEG